jgi:hypothetical protein
MSGSASDSGSGSAKTSSAAEPSSPDNGPCSCDVQTLYVSGLVECELTTPPGSPCSWTVAISGPCGGEEQDCLLYVYVSCLDGSLYATFTLIGFGSQIPPTYVSQNPILITVTIPAAGGCPGGSITISE